MGFYGQLSLSGQPSISTHRDGTRTEVGLAYSGEAANARAIVRRANLPRGIEQLRFLRRVIVTPPYLLKKRVTENRAGRGHMNTLPVNTPGRTSAVRPGQGYGGKEQTPQSIKKRCGIHALLVRCSPACSSPSVLLGVELPVVPFGPSVSALESITSG